MRKSLLLSTMVSTMVGAALALPAAADVTVASWGGAYTMSQQKAYADTWKGGKANFVNYNGGLGEVRTQVEAGNIQWDIVDVLPHEARVGCDEGLFEEFFQTDYAEVIQQNRPISALCKPRSACVQR